MLSGFALGYIYYNPYQEYEEVDVYYEKHQICLLIFAIVITVWKEES
tara:strand:+ start:585 stop:725 length:141 start_codon:yes stop_codon:yes gene_type:complete